MNGLYLDALYSYKPNSLGYCGPKRSGILLRYLKGGLDDEERVKEYLKKFVAAWPYLELLAGDEDPFSYQNVEAYWLGNERTYRTDASELRKMAGSKFLPLMGILPEIPAGAKASHIFHVLFFTTVTGVIKKTIRNMNKCRISWGVVASIDRNKLRLVYKPLIQENRKLRLGEPVKKIIDKGFVSDPEEGDIVTFHWEMGVQKITNQQRKNLEKLTREHISLYNSVH